MDSTPSTLATFRKIPEPVPLPPWDMYTVCVALFSGYILFPLLVSQTLLLAAPFLESSAQLIIQQVVSLVAWIAIFAFLAWKYQVNIIRHLGLKPSMPASYYILQALWVLISMFGLILLFNFWSKATGQNPADPYQKYNHTELTVIAFFAVIMAPAMEELIFRGFVQTTFHKTVSENGTLPTTTWNLGAEIRDALGRIGLRLSAGTLGWLRLPAFSVRVVLFTSLLFLLFHPSYFTDVGTMAYVFLLALALGIWRERTQSVIPGILGHLFNNTLASYIMLHH